MAMKRKSLKKSRTLAYQAQHGRCCYCDQPMWIKTPLELTSRYPITRGQAKLLRCTGEHLVSHSEGGSTGRENIVAACWYCNHTRHARKKVPTPDRYREYVNIRLSKGGWHGLNLVS